MKNTLTEFHKTVVAAILCLTSLMAPASDASAEFASYCGQLSKRPEADSIDDLIAQAEYIGLYTVTEASGDNFAVKPGSPLKVPVVSFKLSRSTSIYGNTPKAITLKGAKPAQIIPESYFFLRDRHQELVDRDSPLLGLSYSIETAEGVCEYVPDLLIGYSYLVFGGANSSAAYEPILSTRYDPFYQAVVSRVKFRK